jgi:catechol 2,3-dioxygenase-like lactoylglutathione lyase family enzyme
VKAATLQILRSAPVVAFVPTSDFQRAQVFYETTLGLTLIGKDEFALLFEAGETRIRVVKVGQFTPAPFTILGWRVPDAAQAVLVLAGVGVKFERYPGMAQDASGIWTAPSGARVAWFKDPDGNVLSVSQQA